MSSAPEPPAALAELLASPPPGARGLRLTHERQTRFRAWVLVELGLAAALSCCLLPLLALALLLWSWLVSEPVFGVDELLARAFTQHHLLRLEWTDANGAALAQAQAPSTSEASAHAALLAAVAAVSGLDGGGVVEERLAWPRPALVARWGEAPAGPVPALEPELVVERSARRLRIALDQPQLPRPIAALFLLALAPLLWPFAGGRASLSDLLADARGLPPERLILEVDGGAFEAWRERGGRRRWSARVPADALLGVSWGPWLSHGRSVEHLKPRLHVLSRPARLCLSLPGDAARGQALTAALTAALGGEEVL